MSTTSNNNELGKMKMTADLRQMGGLLLLFSLAVTVFPQAGVAGLVGPDGTTPSEGMGLSALIGGVFTLTMGFLGLVVGWCLTVFGGGHKYLTLLLALFIQLAYVPFVTDLVAIGKGIKSETAFIPASLNPTPTDVLYTGVMAYFGIFGYAFGYLGAMAFLAFAIYAFQNNNPQARGGKYYKGRLVFYSMLQFFVGFGQFGLGAYLSAKFGTQKFDEPVNAAVYFIHYPILAMVVGAVDILNAVYGLIRGFGLMGTRPDDRSFHISSFVALFINFLGIMIQVSIGAGDAFAAAAPSLFVFTFAIHIFPAYLDHQMMTLPAELPMDYYSPNSTEKHIDLEEPMESSPSADE
ncbi:MAG: hypothetical protein SGILL_010791 [Bacillariaceae sp.]